MAISCLKSTIIIHNPKSKPLDLTLRGNMMGY